MTEQEKSISMRKILEYWFTIEFLTQDSFPEATKKKYRNMVSDVFVLEEKDMHRPLYDIFVEEAQNQGMTTWGNLTFYIGKISREKCIEYIQEFLPHESDEEERPEKDTGQIAVVSLQLSPEGVYVRDSFALSPILWAITQMKRGGENFSDILDNKLYKQEMKELETKYFHPERIPSNSDNNNNVAARFPEQEIQKFSEHAVTGQDLRDLLNDIKTNYVNDYIESDEHDSCLEKIYQVAFQLFKDNEIRSKNEDDNYMGLSHDFYSDDIKFILEKVRDGSLKNTYLGKDLENYILALLQTPERERMDLLDCSKPEELDRYMRTILNILDVKNAPLGKWPSRHMPAFMQQVAVNLSVNKTEEDIGGIFSVNGPPGTGKTTLLKEIIVNNIVERAVLLAKYDDPNDAFETHKFVGGEKEYLNYDQYIHYWYSLKNDKINDYSVLVASCNNAAVENISKELPIKNPKDLEPLQDDPEKLQESLNEVADLFDPNKSENIEIRTNYGKPYSYQDIYFTNYAQALLESEDPNIWGLVSAALGKKSNLNAFYNKVVAPLGADFGSKDKCANRLKQYKMVRKQFLDQLHTVQQFQEQIQNVPKLLKQKMHCKESLDQATLQKLRQESNVEASARLQKEKETLCQSIATKKQERESCLNQVLSDEKSLRFWTKLFNKTKYAAVQKSVEENKHQVEESETQINALNQTLSEKERELSYIKACEEYDAAVKNATQNTGGKYISLDERYLECLFSNDEEISTQAQISNPWFTELYNREREKLFAFAMRLNKEFVLSTRCCSDNIKTLFQYWGVATTGKENERVTFDKRDKEAMVPALIQTLFLFVPVLSTTFASAGTMLKDVKTSGIIGLLVVDEAGQAQPQMALGALYRCRRAVIVGDPNQVEPVVKDDLNLLKKAFREDSLRQYKDKTASVQNFADRLNCFGTYLDNGMDDVEWVGSPLLVHRRCISPMFDISNEISYNKIMKQQTELPDLETEKRFILPKSQWINVSGIEKGNKNHFVEAQGEKVCELLDIAFSKQKKPDLYIISPFTSVVSGIKNYLRRYWKISKENKEYMLDNEYKRIGTVHTFQGREAEEVIFLLGCDSGAASRGAVRWVNNNIVNVAASRAKYRLYIIGDALAWENSACVTTAKNIMDSYAIKRIKKISESELPEDERNNVLQEAIIDLPPLGSFAEESVNEEGDIEYNIETAGFITGLNKEFLDISLNSEQLEKFGFHAKEDLEEFSPEVQENLLLGMKLYFLLQPLYKLNKALDASCCSILFCKALELQMQETFYNALKNILPEFQIRGEGSGRSNIPLKDARKKEMTLGTIAYILKDSVNQEVLAQKTLAAGASKYDASWWENFQKKLWNSSNQRNNCCHSGLFTWKEQSYLLSDIFQADTKGRWEKIGGLIFECDVGNALQT